MADERKRNFATVIYPESCPENFKEIISDWHVPAFLSPLHDKDKNANGEDKKPHYHLLVMFRGKKTKESVRQMFDEVCGVGVEDVLSLDGYARYLCHLDNPEKAQYKKSDVKEFGGAEYEKLILRSSDELGMIIELSNLIISMGIDNVADALMCCLEAGRDDLIRQLTQKSSYWFTALCKANAWKQRQMITKMEKLNVKKNEGAVKDGGAGETNP